MRGGGRYDYPFTFTITAFTQAAAALLWCFLTFLVPRTEHRAPPHASGGAAGAAEGTAAAVSGTAAARPAEEGTEEGRSAANSALTMAASHVKSPLLVESPEAHEKADFG